MKKLLSNSLSSLVVLLSLLSVVPATADTDLDNPHLQRTQNATGAETDIRLAIADGDSTGLTPNEVLMLTDDQLAVIMKPLVDTDTTYTFALGVDGSGNPTMTVTDSNGNPVGVFTDNDTVTPPYVDPDADAVTADTLAAPDANGLQAGTGDINSVDTSADSNIYDPTGTNLTSTTSGDAIDELAQHTRQITTPDTDTTGTGVTAATTPQTIDQNLLLSFTGENENLTDLSAANSTRPQIIMDGLLGEVKHINRNHQGRKTYVSISGSDTRVGDDGRALSPYDLLHPFRTIAAAETALSSNPDFDITRDTIHVLPGVYTATNAGAKVERWILDNAEVTGSGTTFNPSTTNNCYIFGINAKITSTANYSFRMADTANIASDRTVRISGVEFNGKIESGSHGAERGFFIYTPLSSGKIDMIVEDCQFTRLPAFGLGGHPTDETQQKIVTRDCDFRYGLYNVGVSGDGSAAGTKFGQIWHFDAKIKGHANSSSAGASSAAAILFQYNSNGAAKGQNIKTYFVGGHVDATDSVAVFGGDFASHAMTNSMVYLFGLSIHDGKASPKWLNTNSALPSPTFESRGATVNFDPTLAGNTINTWIPVAGTYDVDTNRTR